MLEELGSFPGGIQVTTIGEVVCRRNARQPKSFLLLLSRVLPLTVALASTGCASQRGSEQDVRLVGVWLSGPPISSSYGFDLDWCGSGEFVIGGRTDSSLTWWTKGNRLYLRGIDEDTVPPPWELLWEITPDGRLVLTGQIPLILNNIHTYRRGYFKKTYHLGRPPDRQATGWEDEEKN